AYRATPHHLARDGPHLALARSTARFALGHRLLVRCEEERRGRCTARQSAAFPQLREHVVVLRRPVEVDPARGAVPRVLGRVRVALRAPHAPAPTGQRAGSADAHRRMPSTSGTRGAYPSHIRALSIAWRLLVPNSFTPRRVSGGWRVDRLIDAVHSATEAAA